MESKALLHSLIHFFEPADGRPIWRMAWLLTIIQLFPAAADAKSGLSIEVSDDVSFPLRTGDDGLHFTYRTTSYGDLSAWVRCGGVTYRFFTDMRELAGSGIIRVPASKTAELCENFGPTSTSCSLVAGHVTSRTSQYSEVMLPIRIDVSAPYGCHLLVPPPQPEDLPVTLVTQQKQVLPVMGIIAGCGMILTGVIKEQRERGNDAEVERAHGLMAAGLFIAAFCSFHATKTVPDKHKNARNRASNERCLSQWQNDVQLIGRQNQLIMDTFMIRIIRLD